MTRRCWPEPFAFEAAPPRRLQRLAQAILVAAVLVAALSACQHYLVAGMSRRFLVIGFAAMTALALAMLSLRRARRASLRFEVGADSQLRVDGVPMLPAGEPVLIGNWLWMVLVRPDMRDFSLRVVLELDRPPSVGQAALRRWITWTLTVGSTDIVQNSADKKA